MYHHGFPCGCIIMVGISDTVDMYHCITDTGIQILHVPVG